MKKTKDKSQYEIDLPAGPANSPPGQADRPAGPADLAGGGTKILIGDPDRHGGVFHPTVHAEKFHDRNGVPAAWLRIIPRGVNVTTQTPAAAKVTDHKGVQRDAVELQVGKVKHRFYEVED